MFKHGKAFRYGLISAMNKLLTTIALLCFSVATNANMNSDNLLFLFCSETNNKDYEYLVFMIAEDGWIYDAITTKKARFKAYGATPYSFHTLSPIQTKNPYFEESWVHQAESEYTLLTASNYSREFVIDLNEMKFREIESVVENKHLSGTCAKKNLDAIANRAYQLENEFKDWAKLQQ